MENDMVVRLFRDGSEICALIGPDIMEGTAGFGETPATALRALADQLDSASKRDAGDTPMATAA